MMRLWDRFTGLHFFNHPDIKVLDLKPKAEKCPWMR